MKTRQYQYSRIAAELSEAIRNGVYIAGQRMPSLRTLAARYKISMGTAAHVYDLLEDDGLIDTQPGSGHYVRENQLLEPDSIPQLSSPPNQPQLPSHIQIGLKFIQDMSIPDVLSLGIVATPVTQYLPQAALARTMAGICRRENDKPASYGDLLGYLPLREQISRRMTDAGCHIKPEEILITNGCQEAMFLALSAITKPGDTVIIESPTYFGAIHILEIIGVKALEIPTHPNTGIDLDALQKAIKKHRVAACICMPVCQNPLGASMPEESKQRLVEMLEQENIPLIENDAMGELIFKHPRPCAAKAFDKTGNVIFCSTFSKTMGPGHRVGWIIPGKYIQPIRYLKVVTNGGNAIWMQMAIAEILSRGGYARTLNKSRYNYQKRVAKIRNWILEYFPSGTRVSIPQGGYLLWVELPESIKSLELYNQALTHKIATASGEIFSPSASYTHHIRLNCGEEASDLDRVHDAVRTIGQLAKNISIDQEEHR